MPKSYLTHDVNEFIQTSLFLKCVKPYKHGDYVMNQTSDEVANFMHITMRSYYEMQYIITSITKEGSFKAKFPICNVSSTKVSHPEN